MQFTGDAPPPWSMWIGFIGSILLLLILLSRAVSAHRTFALGIGTVAGAHVIEAVAKTPGLSLVGGEVHAIGTSLFGAAAFVLEAETFPRRWLLLGPTVYFGVACAALWIRLLLIPRVPVTTQSWVGAILYGALTVGALSIPPDASSAERVFVTPLSLGQALGLGALLALMWTGVTTLEHEPTVAGNLGQVMVGPFPAHIVIYYTGALALFGVMIGFLVRGTGLSGVLRVLAGAVAFALTVGWVLPPARSICAALVEIASSLLVGTVAIRLARGVRQDLRLPVTFGLHVITLLVALGISRLVFGTIFRTKSQHVAVMAHPVAASGLILFSIVGIIAILIWSTGMRNQPPLDRAEPLSSLVT